MEVSVESTVKCLLVIFSHICLECVHGHQHGYHNTAQHSGGARGNAVHMSQDTHSGHGHKHERPTGFHDPKVSQDEEHIKEHLEGVADLGDRAMTPEELEFHYFKLHDFDNNTMLDGLEIYKALTHILPFDAIQEDGIKIDRTGKTPEEIKKEELLAEQKYYTDVVDQVLQEDDLDQNGYLTYLEYVLARRREERRSKHEQQQQKSQL